MSNRIQFVCAILAEVRPLWKVLAEQTIGVLVAASLPRALRVAEIDVETSIDPELGVLCHLGALVQGRDLRSCAGNSMMVPTIASRTASAP